VENQAFVFSEIPDPIIKNQVTLFFLLQLLIVFNKIAATPRVSRIPLFCFKQLTGFVRALMEDHLSSLVVSRVGGRRGVREASLPRAKPSAASDPHMPPWLGCKRLPT
jgi:hypothetical protein